MTLVPDLTSCDWMRANPCSQSVKSLVKHLSRVVYGTTTAYKSLFFVKWDFSAVTYGSNNQLSTYIRSCSVHFIDCSHTTGRSSMFACTVCAREAYLHCKELNLSRRGFFKRVCVRLWISIQNCIICSAISLSLSLWSSVSPSLRRGMPLINSKTRLGSRSD